MKTWKRFLPQKMGGFPFWADVLASLISIAAGIANLFLAPFRCGVLWEYYFSSWMLSRWEIANGLADPGGSQWCYVRNDDWKKFLEVLDNELPRV